MGRKFNTGDLVEYSPSGKYFATYEQPSPGSIGTVREYNGREIFVTWRDSNVNDEFGFHSWPTIFFSKVDTTPHYTPASYYQAITGE